MPCRYVFRVFFIQFFGICIFGMAHGLVFLPVLLSLVGPGEIKAGKPVGPSDIAIGGPEKGEEGGAPGKNEPGVGESSKVPGPTEA